MGPICLLVSSFHFRRGTFLLPCFPDKIVTGEVCMIMFGPAVVVVVLRRDGLAGGAFLCEIRWETMEKQASGR